MILSSASTDQPSPRIHNNAASAQISSGTKNQTAKQGAHDAPRKTWKSCDQCKITLFWCLINMNRDQSGII